LKIPFPDFNSNLACTLQLPQCKEDLGTKPASFKASKRIFQFGNTGDSHLQDSSDIQAGSRPSGRQVPAAANRMRQWVAAP